MQSITPILMAGGAGTRLWPLSRASLPKQFSDIIGGDTLFQRSAKRTLNSDFVKFEPHLIVTANDYRFIVSEQLNEIGVTPGSIIIEPEIRNTAAAILAACLHVNSKGDDKIMMASPCDHVVADLDEFHTAVMDAVPAVNDGKIVTFGIKPTRPETGFGYIKFNSSNIRTNGYCSISKFVEKPTQEVAIQMLKNGDHLWNSGIFMFRAAIMIDEFRTQQPELFEAVRESIKKSYADLQFTRLHETSWASCPNISIDYAIMERSSNLAVIPVNCGWNDLGDWNAIHAAMPIDKNKVAKSQNAYSFDCNNSILRSEVSQQILVGVGVQDMIVVTTKDAVLVASKEKSQDIKGILDELKKEDVTQLTTFTKDYRPWGYFESVAKDKRFQVKEIVVNVGASLSLQSHQHRSEHWVVVEGTATVTINKEEQVITEGESVYIPVGAKHRLENRGKITLKIIEIQTGSYLGEDDIIRYDDVYSRHNVFSKNENA